MIRIVIVAALVSAAASQAFAAPRHPDASGAFFMTTWGPSPAEEARYDHAKGNIDGN